MSGRRGLYQFRSTRLTASDLLGVLQRRTVLTARSTLLVLPEILALDRLAIRMANTGTRILWSLLWRRVMARYRRNPYDPSG